MRIIRALIFSIIAMAILAGAVFLIGREILLSMGIAQVRSSATQLRSIAKNTGVYVQECRKKGVTPSEGGAIKTIQLRFTSSRDYQLEVICSQFTLSPIIVSSGTLPFLVEKVPGTSGLLWTEGRTGLEVTVLGRTGSVIMDNQQLVRGNLSDYSGLSQPVTSCSGYGYSCCVPETTQGVGDSNASALDCPRTCFSTCQPRPVILALTTQPFFDQKTRILQIGPNEPIEFHYVAEVIGEKSVEVELDFGDGNTERFTTLSGETNHTYQCPAGICDYTVQLSVTDADGIAAAETPLSRIQVQVR